MRKGFIQPINNIKSCPPPPPPIRWTLVMPLPASIAATLKSQDIRTWLKSENIFLIDGKLNISFRL